MRQRSIEITHAGSGTGAPSPAGLDGARDCSSGSTLGRRFGWSRISEPVSIPPVSFPMCCVSFVDVAQLSAKAQRAKRPASPAAKSQRPADKSRYQGGKALPGPGSHLARIFQNELFPSLPPARLNRATLAPPGTRTRSARTPVHRKSEERRGQLSPASWHAPMPAQPSSPSHHATSL